MPKDTQLSNQKLLALLRTADERMLNDSGNPVYLKMKAELDLLRAVQAEQRSEDHIESSSTGRSFPIRLEDIPILGVRIGPGGQRLVYRAQRPRDELNAYQRTQLDTDVSLDDVDKTLVDVVPDTKLSDSK